MEKKEKRAKRHAFFYDDFHLFLLKNIIKKGAKK